MLKRKKLNDGTIVNPWKLTEGMIIAGKGRRKRWMIKRWIVLPDGRGTNEHLPLREYEHILDNKEQLKELVIRENAKIFKIDDSIEKILERNAFLSPAMLDKYETYLESTNVKAGRVRAEMACLKRHCINVFISRLNLENPADWYADRARWLKYLRSSPDAPPAAASKQRVVQVLNRFMAWLHEERPNEIPQTVFKGLTEEILRDVEDKRAQAGDKKERRDIPDEHWEIISECLNQDDWKDIRPWIMLCYHYGLRRAEALGLTYRGVDAFSTEDVEVERQLESFNPREEKVVYEKLKTQGRNGIHRSKKREKREVKHWLDMEGTDPKTGKLRAEQAADWIEEGHKVMMHPDTLTHRWAELMDKLKAKMDGQTYEIHELRHTWISRAVEKYDLRQVQLCAGHASIETTEKYIHIRKKPTKRRLREKKAA